MDVATRVTPMAGTPVTFSRRVTLGQRFFELGLTNSQIVETTFPTPISKLMFYLHCVNQILDLTVIPGIEILTDYTNYLWLTEPFKDLLVFWCFYLSPTTLKTSKVLIENNEICAESAVMTIDKRTVPAVSGLEYIHIYGRTFKVKKLLACSSGWLLEFNYLPILAEKYRCDRVLESMKTGLVQPHSSCCTLL